MQRSGLKGSGITAGAFVLAVGIIGAAPCEPCTDTGMSACRLHPATRGNGLLLGAFVGAFVGLPVGALVGLFLKTEWWEKVARRRVQPTVQPLPAGRIEFGLSLPTGR